jgi:hypothetical protein
MLDFLYTKDGIVTVDNGEIITVEFAESVRLAYQGEIMFGYLDGKGKSWSHSFEVDCISDEILWLKEYNEQFAIPLSLNGDREHERFGFLHEIVRVFKQENSAYPILEVDSRSLVVVPSILYVEE